MEEKYFCLDCQSRFSETGVRKVIESYEIWGANVSHDHYFNVCPICGSDDFMELTKCRLCDEYVPDGADFCDPHLTVINEIMTDAFERLAATTNADAEEVKDVMFRWIDGTL
jgi:hypothetical protein